MDVATVIRNAALESKSYFYYHIALFDQNHQPVKNKKGGWITYRGITNNIKRRMQQHNGLIKGGAHATTIHMFQNKVRRLDRVWCHLYIVGPFIHATDCRRFEPCTKQKCKKTRIQYCDENKRKEIQNRMKRNPICDTIVALNMSQYGSKSGYTMAIPLTLTWFCDTLRSDNFDEMLPETVNECYFSNDQKREILLIGSRSKTQYNIVPFIESHNT